MVIDENYNGIVDNNEHKFFSNEKKYISISEVSKILNLKKKDFLEDFKKKFKMLMIFEI